MIYKYNVYKLNLKKHCSEKRGIVVDEMTQRNSFINFHILYLPKPKLLDRPSLTKTQRVTIVFNFAMSTHVQCQHKDHEAKNVARYEKPLSVSIFIKYGKFWITSLSHIIKHKLLISEECKYSFTDVLLKLSLWCNNFKTG